MGEINDNGFPFAGSYDKRFYHLAGLWDILGIISQRFFAYPSRVFFQYIQKTVRIVIPIFVIYNGNLYRFDLVIAGSVRTFIIA